MTPDIVVVGAGVFGLTAALELCARGYGVVVFEAGPIPRPEAASTDVSKVVRMEYGTDQTYMSLMEEALGGWRRWNAELARTGGRPFFHETGVLMISRASLEDGGFEHDSLESLRRRGHSPERLDAEAIARRYPAWGGRSFVDGFYHAHGGLAESATVVSWLAARAASAGIEVHQRESVETLLVKGDGVHGVRTRGGREVRAGAVVLAAGAWSSTLLPDLRPEIRATGHPVFHLQPSDPGLFEPSRFPVFTADVAQTGYYGFPLHRDGFVKIARHGAGRPVDPGTPGEPTADDLEDLRSFLSGALPALANAPVSYSRVCAYADTPDGDFWIAPDPQRAGLVVAGGGSGHGFKFAPVLGGLIADAVEGRTSQWLERFRWRRGAPAGRGDAARAPRSLRDGPAPG